MIFASPRFLGRGRAPASISFLRDDCSLFLCNIAVFLAPFGALGATLVSVTLNRRPAGTQLPEPNNVNGFAVFFARPQQGVFRWRNRPLMSSNGCLTFTRTLPFRCSSFSVMRPSLCLGSALRLARFMATCQVTALPTFSGRFAHHQTLFGEVSVDRIEYLARQNFCFEQVTKFEQLRRVWRRLAAQIDADGSANGLAAVDRIFNAFVRQTEALLGHIRPQHSRQHDRWTTGAFDL
jgi:hypothetical protein